MLTAAVLCRWHGARDCCRGFAEEQQCVVFQLRVQRHGLELLRGIGGLPVNIS
jgi:hypothetical protein